MQAAEAVHRLFGMVPPQDVGDAEAFLTASITLFARYSNETRQEAVIEIATRSDRPTLKLMKQVLAELEERQIEREEREQRRLRLPAPDPRKSRSPEEQARVDASIEEWRRIKLQILSETDISKAG